MMAVLIFVGTPAYFLGEKAGYHAGWDSACATFGPRDNPDLCSVSLNDAERFRKGKS
jgi:hypothetical protein